MYKIYIGSLDDPLYYFEQPQTFGAKSTQRVNLVGQELTIDTFEPVVMDDIDKLRNVMIFRSSDGHEILVGAGEIYAKLLSDKIGVSGLIDLPYGTPLWYFYEQMLIGKFYIKNVDRVGTNKYQPHCVSVIGLLDKMQHSGGLFLRSTFGQVVKHILHGEPEV